MEQLFSFIGSFVPFIVLMGVVIAVHEYGHFAVLRLFGGAVESFSIGFGRSVFERTDKRGTRWKLSWIPFGGYVSWVREAQLPELAKRPIDHQPKGKHYELLAPWQRMFVALGGPLANFVFAIAIYAVFAMSFPQASWDSVIVKKVMPESAAEQAGLLPGDEIVRLDGQAVKSPDSVRLTVQYSSGDPLQVRVLRNDETLDLIVVPETKLLSNASLNIEEEIGVIGVEFLNNATIGRMGPIDAVALGVDKTLDLMRTTARVIVRLVQGKEDFEKMRGPLGIGDLADRVVDSQMKRAEIPLSTRIANAALSMVQLAAFFSISIGFMNLLPIPMLDGFHVLVGAIETLLRVEIPESIQEKMQLGGLVALGFFLVAVSFNDVKRISVLEVFGRMLS